MTVIATVGLPGSGKGEAATQAEAFGIPVVTMGDVIRQACRDRGLDPAEHHGEVAQALREENGPGAIAEESLPQIEDALGDSDVVLVDGVRSGVEVDQFEAAFGDDFTLVSIEAPAELRKERLTERGRDNLDGESLEERDERELGFGMGEAMERADVRIENTESLEAFQERIRDVIESEIDGDLGDDAGSQDDATATADDDATTDGGTAPDDGAVYKVDVEITAPVYPTEVTDRVADAVHNLFPEAEIEHREGELAGTAHSMERFSELLHEREILDTARDQFFANRRGDTVSFDLKKQAAFEGLVNFAVGQPDELGELHVRVRVHEPSVEAYVDHVAPRTEDGRPVET